MKLGFIGFGEVSYEMASGLKKEGLTDIVAYDPLQQDLKFSNLVNSRATNAGVRLLGTPTEVVKEAEIIFAAVPGSKALQAAIDVVSALYAGKLYVDVSTSSPQTKKNIAKAVESTGALFVDGAMMGGLSIYQHKVPTLVSGRGSDQYMALMAAYHMSLEKVSDNPGDAIAVKLVRSIYMKGIASLAVEMLEAAANLGVDSLVLKSISDMMDAASFEEMMDFLVCASAIHAERQVHEMVDVRDMLIEMGIEPIMTIATEQRLRWLASKDLKEKFSGKKPDSWQKVVDAW